jgi:tetratricopeptide (TPR) repeat protein
MGIVALAVLLLSSSAFGDDVDDRRQAREHFEKGTRLYELGHFDEAIKEYETAYQLKNDPTLLFNVAQAHRLAGQHQQALFNYRSYLHKVPNASNRDEVERLIVELQKRLDQPTPSATKAEPTPAVEPDRPTPPATSPVTPTPAAAQSAPSAVVTSPAPDRGASSRRTYKVAGLSLLGIGALGLIGGVTSTALTVSASNSVTQEATQHQPFDPSKQHAGKATQLAADVLYSIGGAAVLSGAVLTYLGLRKPKLRSVARNLSPTIGLASVGVAWTGTFE